MNFCTVFLTTDTSLGRINKDTLTDQSLMELMIDGLSERVKTKYRDTEGFYRDINDWDFLFCSEEKNVIVVQPFRESFSGSLALDYIPQGVTHFGLDARPHHGRFRQNLEVTGTLRTETLPSKLEVFDISRMRFTGTVDMRQLPSLLRLFNVSMNDFEGTCDLSELPKRLGYAYLFGNRFSGSVRLENLPTFLRNIRVDNNRFSGEVFIDRLPHIKELNMERNELRGLMQLNLNLLQRRISAISFGNNMFTGKVDLPGLPGSLRRIELHSNALCGSIVLIGLPKSLKKLFLQENAFEGTIELQMLPELLEILDVSKNSLCGLVSLLHLPNKLQSLKLSDNAFSGSVNLDFLPENLENLHLLNNQLTGSISLDNLPQSLTQLFLEGNAVAFPDEIRKGIQTRAMSDETGALESGAMATSESNVISGETSMTNDFRMPLMLNLFGIGVVGIAFFLAK